MVFTQYPALLDDAADPQAENSHASLSTAGRSDGLEALRRASIASIKS
jgi:hypothetical protein